MLDGIDVLQKAMAEGFDGQFIMISAHGTIETAVEATKMGAFDFIQKPPDLNRLLVTVKNALEKTDLVTETKVLRKKVAGVSEIIGESSAIQAVKDTIDRVAPTEARVLITGPNGTGKRTSRQVATRPEQPSASPPGRTQLRRYSIRIDRERAVRSREGIVHLGHQAKERTL